jgi:Alanine dehydrogenase/PNT, C-terminal domain
VPKAVASLGRATRPAAKSIGKSDQRVRRGDLVPGRPAPRLVTAAAVEAMKPDSAVVDLAGEAGGNCELTEPGQTVVKHDVTIAAPLNLPATMPEHASELYSKNITALLDLLIADCKLAADFDDDLVVGGLRDPRRPARALWRPRVSASVTTWGARAPSAGLEQRARGCIRRSDSPPCATADCGIAASAVAAELEGAPPPRAAPPHHWLRTASLARRLMPISAGDGAMRSRIGGRAARADTTLNSPGIGALLPFIDTLRFVRPMQRNDTFR